MEAYMRVIGNEPISVDEVAKKFESYFGHSYPSTMGILDMLQRNGLVKVSTGVDGVTTVYVLKLEVGNQGSDKEVKNG